MVWDRGSLAEACHVTRVRQILAEYQDAFQGAPSLAALERLEEARASETVRRDILEACERLERLRAYDKDLAAAEGPLLGRARQYFLSGGSAAYEA